jgi:hypothetical protein
MRLNTSITGNLIAAAIATVLFIVITLATGGGVALAVGGGVVLGLFTFVVAFAITRVIASRHS